MAAIVGLCVFAIPGSVRGETAQAGRQVYGPRPLSCPAAMCRSLIADDRLTVQYRRCKKAAGGSLPAARVCADQELARQEAAVAVLQRRAELGRSAWARDVQAGWIEARDEVCASVAADFGGDDRDRRAVAGLECRLHMTAKRAGDLEHDLAL